MYRLKSILLLSSITMIPNFKILVQTKGSSTLSPAHGKGGARATILFLSATPPEKSAGGFQQAGKKEGGLGEGIFARLLSAPKARQGWEAARSCVSRKTKPAKIDSLKEKIFCARPLKEKDIFVDFVRREAASRWGGFLPVRAEIVAQKRFALRSVIATNLNIVNFAGSLFARSPRLRRVSLRKKPVVWRLNQTAGEARRGLVLKAGGGSELRSNSQMKFVSNFFLSAFGGIRSQFLIPRFTAKGD